MLQGNTGHRVFSTIYGKVAVNICYGRHHPQVDDENYYDDNDGDGNAVIIMTLTMPTLISSITLFQCPELDDVRTERSRDCFQSKRHCWLPFRAHVGD